MQRSDTQAKTNIFFNLLFLISYLCISGHSIASENITAATLKIEFPGLNSVHTEIRLSDGISNSASGNLVKSSNWKKNSTTVTVTKDRFDLIIKKGADRLIIDDVDCTSGICMVSNLTAKLTVHFPQMSSVHTSIFVPDNIPNNISKQKVTSLNWQNDKAILTVLRKRYDLSIKKGMDSIIIDNVDCSSGQCLVDNLTAKMTVDFPGLNAMHTSVYAADGTDDTHTGDKYFYKNWQNNQALLTVFKKLYDVSIRRKNSIPLIKDNVDCRSGQCNINNIVSTLTVNFSGMSSIHTSVHQTDGQVGVANGNEFAHKNWQKNQAKIIVLKQKYDVSIRSNHSKSIIKDNIDCTSGSCSIDQLTATLTVNFPKMSSIHTSVKIPDGKKGSADGEKVFNLNWQKNQAIIKVFKQKYDVSIKPNQSAPIIRDNIDCTSGNCVIDQLTATLTVKFPKMSSIHTSVLEPDGKNGVAEGQTAFKLNWQKDQAIIHVFKQKYDVRIKGNHSNPIIKDNIDCTSGSCLIDKLTATLTVKFPNMSSIHTSAHVPDGNIGKAEGVKTFKLNWQSNQALITVFKQSYDISVRRGNTDPMIIDNLDCSAGSCLVDNLTALLTVKFPNLKNVHTSVRIPDNIKGQASGGQSTHKNWQKNQAIITVFKQKFDVQIKKGPITKIIDNIDCTTGNCLIENIVSTLTIDFPGLSSVHSSVHIPDSNDNTADGELASKLNWQRNQASITILRETYDVKINHGINSIFDNVDCTTSQCNLLIKGNVQAFLIDGDSKKPIANKALTAYEKKPDGTLVKTMRGTTTSLGKINFTLPDLTSGKIYVLKAYSPFGNGKSYFSSFITSEGTHNFIVTVDGENSLDLTPPEIIISSPKNNTSVPHQGFSIKGTATDNRKIDRVEISISDPIKGISNVSSSYNESTNSWISNVPAALVSIDNTIQISATVYDLAQNKNTTTSTVTVIEDTLGPEILITSHIANDEVPSTGFLLSGTVTDLTGVASLQATLVDSSLGTAFSDKNLNFSINNGSWTLVINNGLLTEGGTVDISFTASDTINNTSSKSIKLSIVAVDFSNRHMINRITFGSTPELIDALKNQDALSFLEEQLDPNSINNSEFDNQIGNLPTSKEELQTWTLKHMAFSKRQLQEVMTWFWDNHFNTNINTKRTNAQGIKLSNTVGYELDENQAFRTNALGNFGDLLEISAKSPAMLIYLDSISNVVSDSNENYAREVYELHTLGIEGGYTSKDVENGAEIFTGWHVKNGVFFFDDTLHSIASYTLFEGTNAEQIIPQGGVEQGEALLNALASHPSTASYICTKLITLFVSDTPPESLVTRCATEFRDHSNDADQIKRLLRLIVQSAEFNNPNHYRSKIKTPIEFVIGAIRNLNASTNATDLISPIRKMGIQLYENPVPTGWSELGADWINASLLIERIKWINTLAQNSEASGLSNSNPIIFYSNKGFETADGIVGFLLKMTVADDFTDLGLSTAINILGTDFDLNLPDAEQKLRQLNGTVLSYPQYQFQ